MPRKSQDKPSPANRSSRPAELYDDYDEMLADRIEDVELESMTGRTLTHSYSLRASEAGSLDFDAA